MLFQKDNRIVVEPCISVNQVLFGTPRENVRKAFGDNYKEFKKTNASVNTTDAYDLFHIYYDNNNLFEAIEIFGDVDTYVANKKIYPGAIKKVIRICDDMEYDGYGYTSVNNSIGISISGDSKQSIDSILFGKKGYYNQ